jgi:hypothetical protein
VLEECDLGLPMSGVKPERSSTCNPQQRVWRVSASLVCAAMNCATLLKAL